MYNFSAYLNCIIIYIDHYDRIATAYDSYLQYYHDGVIQCIAEHLPIDTNDIVVDIGGGTGEIASKLWKQAILKNPVLCVDPSENMVKVANTKEGVTGVQAYAEEFFGSELSSGKSYDKVLMCGSAHLFSDSKAVFAGVKECLSKKGVCLVLDPSSLSPLFRSLKEEFGEGYLTWEPLYEILTALGLKFKTIRSTQKFSIPKSQWYAGLRDRFLTKLGKFTDEEIEEGILELEKKYGNQDILEIEAGFKFALITKF